MCCTLVVQTNGLSGSPPASTADAGDAADAADAADGGDLPDAFPRDGSPEAGATFVSCAAAKEALPLAADGPQTIDPDGAGPLVAFVAWCDMTQDKGGWTLVNADALADASGVAATEERSAGDHDGLVLRVYANAGGCGTGPRPEHRFLVKDRVAWQRIRLRQIFAGQAGCWHIWGAAGGSALVGNVIMFSAGTDAIRGEVRMGGAAGDAFDGTTVRCDTTPANFWNYGTKDLRSATVILRRRDASIPGGLATGADCSTTAPGNTSPTWWEYRDIYVK